MSLSIQTPLGELLFEAKARPATQIALSSAPFLPQLPRGMSVSACVAVVFRVEGVARETEISFEATLRPSAEVCNSAATGEALEAQEWSAENFVLLVGTEDSEFLTGRTGSHVNGLTTEFVYSPTAFAVRVGFAACQPFTLHFLIAWNALPEPVDASCWFAVEQPHLAILAAMSGAEGVAG